MAIEYCNTKQEIAPAAAAPVSMSAGAAWANSTWVEVLASAPAALLLTGVAVQKNGTAMGDSDVEIDVGTGSGGAETVIATIRFAWLGAACGVGWIPFPIPIDNIANAARVAVRLRKTDSGTDVMLAAITYWQKPVSGSVTPTAQRLRPSPSAADGVSITPNASAWANSSWQEIVASTSTAWALAGVVLRQGDQGIDYRTVEVDIGTGSGGAESVITTVRFGAPNGAGNGMPNLKPLWPVLDNIGNGARVAARVRVSDTAAQAVNVSLSYYEQTL